MPWIVGFHWGLGGRIIQCHTLGALVALGYTMPGISGGGRARACLLRVLQEMQNSVLHSRWLTLPKVWGAPPLGPGVGAMASRAPTSDEFGRL